MFCFFLCSNWGRLAKLCLLGLDVLCSREERLGVGSGPSDCGVCPCLVSDPFYDDIKTVNERVLISSSVFLTFHSVALFGPVLIDNP